MTDSQKAITVMCGLFRDFTPEKAMLYDKFLRDIPAALVGMAVESLIKTSTFPPTVAEIRSEAKRIYETAMGKSPPSASGAWGEVKEQISRTGRYGTPVFQDDITALVVRRFGWQCICDSSDPEGVLRGQFMKAYDETEKAQRQAVRMQAALQDGRMQALAKSLSARMALEGGRR